jgi:ATP-binding cassette subfamily F protein 3
MSLLNVSQLAKFYGAEKIFSDVSFQVAKGDKLALVGINGAGKSTLLKIIAGIERASEGSVHLARGTRVAYLAQEVRFSGELTLWEEMEQAFAHLNELSAELRKLEEAIADTQAPDWDARMARYGELTVRFEHSGGYEVEQRIKRTLQGLGFVEAQFHQRVEKFSGGQKTRAALAYSLLSDPDLLLLDEPTNHLDLAALEWLEGFLRQWDGTLIVISHDRYFLDRVTKRTIEVAFGTIEDYAGGYNKYLQLKAERMELRLKQFAAQQAFIAKTEEFIRRFKAGQRSKEAKGREKRLNRMLEGKDAKNVLIERPKDPAKLKLFLDTQLRSGELALKFDGFKVGYTDATGRQVRLFSTPELEMRRGERVALMGANGSGKTTLLRTLIGEVPAQGGRALLGHNVHLSYYAQGHDSLRMENTVLDEVQRIDPLLGETAARTLLGRFLFSGDDVFKRVSELSGGERSRVALAQLTLLPGNLLILDEPTNHLDIDAREALEGVLKDYQGSILFVSHDRYFIDAIADTIWMVENETVRSFAGNYSEYAAAQELQAAAPARGEETKRASESKAASSSPKAAPAAAGRPAADVADERKRKRRQQALESEVAMLETELAKLKVDFDAACAAQDVPKITALGTQYAELENLLAQRYDEWAAIAS